VIPTAKGITSCGRARRISSYQRDATASGREQDRQLLAHNLHIIEVRKIRQKGLRFERFPKKESDKQAIDFWKQLIQENSADLYLIDPMRCFHIGKENDSEIELREAVDNNVALAYPQLPINLISSCGEAVTILRVRTPGSYSKIGVLSTLSPCRKGITVEERKLKPAATAS
jgi:hypothetical protein